MNKITKMMINLDPKHQNYTVQNPFKKTYEEPQTEGNAKQPDQWSPYVDNGGTVVGKFPFLTLPDS